MRTQLIAPPPLLDPGHANLRPGLQSALHRRIAHQTTHRQYRRKAVNMDDVIDPRFKRNRHGRTNVHYSLMVTVTRFIHKNPLAPPPAIRHYCRDWRVDGQFTALTWRHSL